MSRDVTNLYKEIDELAFRIERQERIAIWAEKLSAALRILGSMAGYPIPDELAALLTERERDALALVLAALPEGGTDE